MARQDNRNGRDTIVSLLRTEECPELVHMSPSGIDRYLREEYNSDGHRWLREIYYRLKPAMPRRMQLHLRRMYAASRGSGGFPAWPIEPAVAMAVKSFLAELTMRRNGGGIARIAPWPQGKTFAFVITHDVEWDAGLRHAPVIAEMERKFGFVSSWNIVPERYPIDQGIVTELRDRGLEIGVHGLRHDGRLFQSRRTFRKRAEAINNYGRRWHAAGFRSPSMLRRADWMELLEFEYDSSFPDTDPYEPQPGGCCSIWPYFLGRLVELPLTMPQDHTIFEILGHEGLSVWHAKAEWIAREGGMILINLHPDYNTDRKRLGCYERFLEFMAMKEGMWHSLPREAARWWRARDNLTITAGQGVTLIRGNAPAPAWALTSTVSGGRLTHSAAPSEHRFPVQEDAAHEMEPAWMFDQRGIRR